MNTHQCLWEGNDKHSGKRYAQRVSVSVPPYTSDTYNPPYSHRQVTPGADLLRAAV